MKSIDGWKESSRRELRRALARRLNRTFFEVVGGSRRCKVFDVESIDPRLSDLDDNWRTILDELEPLLRQRESLPRYHDVDPAQMTISSKTPGQWNVFMLHMLGQTPPSATQTCPQTCRLLEGIPNKFQAFFSILEPGKSIPAHNGPYLGYLRYHLGIKVPKIKPPSLRIEDRHKSWREGESFMFDDSWEHEVYNESDEVRAILVVDLFRPMPVWPDLLNRIASRLGPYKTYGRQVIRRQERVFGRTPD